MRAPANQMSLFGSGKKDPVEHEPPDHLGPESSEFWSEVCRSFFLEGHHRKILESACSCWDRRVSAREQIQKDGSFIEDRYGQTKAHPALAVERDNKILLARLIRELQLDVELSDGQPPRLY